MARPQRWAMAVVLLAYLARAEGLPAHVFLKSTQRGLAWENEYALFDGKLWVKPNDDLSGKQGAWQLFEGTGVPFGDKAPSFGPKNRLVQFGTDGTMILAVSDTGRFYNWQPTLSNHTVWMDKMGSPFEEELLLPKNRTWSFSFSVDTAPEKRVTPMHDIVSYYEDADGNKIQFGFTATLFVLDPDGQRIRFWDTGLPASFHKAFATPERGRFVAINMSTAASTILVIDSTGRMFTKMHDYEMFAACPGLRYTYTHARRTKSDAEVMPLMEALRTLPLPDWREQPAVELQGAAVITSELAILQNGKGNAARELRVQGRDAAGRDGYYFKPIFAPAWSFRATGEPLDERKVLRGIGGPPVLGRVMDKAYAGKLERVGQRAIDVELINFYYYASSATLRVHAGLKSVDLRLELADAWGPTVQQKYHPELVGSPAGEPKLLMGTLELSAEAKATKDPELRRVLDRYFTPYDLVTFALEVAATDRNVTILTRTIQRDSPGFADYTLRHPVLMKFTRAAESDEVQINDGYTYLALLAGLEVTGLEKREKKDLPQITKALEQNKALLKQIRATNALNRTKSLNHAAMTATGAGAFFALNGAMTLTGIPSRHTLAGGLSMSGGSPLNMYARLNLQLALDNTEDYERAVALLEKRITALKARREALSR